MPAKFERCVRKVRKQGTSVNPYAVCKAAMRDKSMAHKTKLGQITRKPKMFYYVDGQGRVFERNMKTGHKAQVNHVTRPPMSLVYVDAHGYILATPMKRRGRK